MDTLFSNLVKTFLKLIQLTSSRDCFVIVSNIPLPIPTHTHTQVKEFLPSRLVWGGNRWLKFRLSFWDKIIYLSLPNFFFWYALRFNTIFMSAKFEGQCQIINAHNDFNLPRLKYPESNRLKATRCHHFFFVFGNALFH